MVNAFPAGASQCFLYRGPCLPAVILEVRPGPDETLGKRWVVKPF